MRKKKKEERKQNRQTNDDDNDDDDYTKGDIINDRASMDRTEGEMKMGEE